MAGDIEDVFEAFFPEEAPEEAPDAQPPPALARQQPPSPERDGLPEREERSPDWLGVPVAGPTDPHRMATVWYLGQSLTLAPNRRHCALLARGDAGQETPWPHAGEERSRGKTPFDRMQSLRDPGTGWRPAADGTVVLDCMSPGQIQREAPGAWLLLVGEDPDWACERALEIGLSQHAAPIWATAIGPAPTEEHQARLRLIADQLRAAGGPPVRLLEPVAIDPVLLFGSMTNQRPLTAFRDNAAPREAIAELATRLLEAVRSPLEPGDSIWLLDALSHADPALRTLATGVLIGASPIDAVALDEQGQLVAVFDAREDDLACFTRALGALADLERSLPTWWDAGEPRALLLAPAFQPATRAASERLTGGEVALREAPDSR